MSLDWCRAPDVGLPRPDLCLFLDISAEDAAKRGGYGTEKYEKKEMQDRVRGLFETLMQKPEGEDFVRIEAGRGEEDVAAQVRQEVDRCIERVVSWAVYHQLQQQIQVPGTQQLNPYNPPGAFADLS